MTKVRAAMISYATFSHTFRARTPRGNAMRKGTLLKIGRDGMLILAKSHRDARFIVTEDRPKGSFSVIAGMIK